MPAIRAEKRQTETVTWRLEGPGGTWSIWDFGDELAVHEGPGLLDRVAARIRPEIAHRLDTSSRRANMEHAAGAIHVAKLLGSSSPTFRMLWNY